MLEQINSRVLQIPDKVGREPRLMIWSHPGNDVSGMVPRCEKVVTTCEQVYFYAILFVVILSRGMTKIKFI